MNKLNGFCKEERLCSKKLIEELFSSGSKSVSVHPIRTVYRIGRYSSDATVSVMMSVSKRHFHNAVDRNRVKRQLRESYRLQKSVLLKAFKTHPEDRMIISFIWQDGKKYDTEAVMNKMKVVLQILAEKVAKKYSLDEKNKDEQGN